MSTLYLPIYRTEAGVQTNPATMGLYATNCDGGVLGSIKKRFYEVLIHWTGSAWIEDPVFVPGQSIVALKVENSCNDTFALIDYPFSDFRIAQNCCISEVIPTGDFIIEEDNDFIITEDNNFLIIE